MHNAKEHMDAINKGENPRRTVEATGAGQMPSPNMDMGQAQCRMRTPYPPPLQEKLDILERRLKILEEERHQIFWAISHITKPEIVEDLKCVGIIERSAQRNGPNYL